MATQNEEEIERVLVDATNRIPSTKLLIGAIAFFTALFGSLWQIGIDPAPDRWRGSDDRAYREEHAKQHEIERKEDVMARSTTRSGIVILQLGAAVDKEKLRAFGLKLQEFQTEHNEREAWESAHEKLLEHTGANRRLERLERMIRSVDGE